MTGVGSIVVHGSELYEPDPDLAVPSMTILHRTEQIMSFSWRGVGTLERSDSLNTPNWQPVPGQANPQILRTSGAMKFYRVKAE